MGVDSIEDRPESAPNGAVAAYPSSDDRATRAQEDRRLLVRYHREGDPAAREQLVTRFLPLARQLARRYQRGGEQLDDLVQVASLGLLKAIDRFDPARETAFSSFAVPTILGELKRHFRDKGWSVRVPRDLQELSVKVDRVADDMSRTLGRIPTPAELAAETGTSLEQVLEAREASAAYRAVSLDRPRTEDEEDGDSYADAVGDDDPGYHIAEASATVQRLMRVLSEREREVLRLRFEEDLTQSEIGEPRRRVPDARLAPDPPVDRAVAHRGRAARLRYGRSMDHWDLSTLDVQPHHPQILHSSRGESRTIAIRLPAGEELQDHEVHERAHLVVVEGEVDVDAGSVAVHGGPGFVAVFDPTERHAVRATTDARLLLVLAPWPGDGHPGARD